MNKSAEISHSENEKAPQLKARNASRMAEISRPHFDSAYANSRISHENSDSSGSNYPFIRR